MKASLILKNCNLVNEGTIKPVDISVKNDRIDQISNIIDCEAEQVIDCGGRFVAPGIIDDQVHFRDPGLTKKAISDLNRLLQFMEESLLHLICQMSIRIQQL